MSTRRRLSPLAALLLAVPAAARAQIAEAVPQPAEPPSLAVVLEATADSPEFAAQRAETRLQNAAEIVRQLGTQVARSDTIASGVSRLPEVNGTLFYHPYPPPPYVARVVLRVHLARAADVMAVSAALARAGAAGVYVTNPQPAR